MTKLALTADSHSKSLAYDPLFESMLASMHRCKHFMIQESALPCLDKALTMHMIFALGMTVILPTILGGESYAENQS